MTTATYTTVRMAARNVAKEELTACKELANVLSIVSISFPKRLSMRPNGNGCEQMIDRRAD